MPSRPSGYSLPLALWVGGLSAFAIVATMNAVFAAKYGVGDFERGVSIGAAVVIDAACVLLAAVFGKTLAVRAWGASALSFLFLAIVLGLSMATAVGYFGIARLAPAEATRVNAANKTAAAKNVSDRLARQAEMWQSQVSIAKGNEKRILIDESRTSLKAMLDVPEVSAAEAMPDPFGATVAKYSGVQEHVVQAIFLSVLAAVLVLLKVVLVGFGTYLWPQREAETAAIVAVKPPVQEPVEDLENGDNSSVLPSNNNVIQATFGDRHPYQADTVANWLLHGQSAEDEASGDYKSLYDRYSDWCSTVGLIRVGGRVFGGHLQRLGCQRYRTNGVTFYRLNCGAKSMARAA